MPSNTSEAASCFWQWLAAAMNDSHPQSIIVNTHQVALQPPTSLLTTQLLNRKNGLIHRIPVHKRLKQLHEDALHNMSIIRQ